MILKGAIPLLTALVIGYIIPGSDGTGEGNDVIFPPKLTRPCPFI